MAVTSLFVTEETGVGLAEVDMCTFEINIKYELIPTIVCSACFLFGLIYSFFGTYDRLTPVLMLPVNVHKI